MARAYHRGTPAERFRARVAVVESGCHEWQGYRHEGYGRFGITPQQTVLAHRFAYELARGPIPEGLCVLHRCDNPACVNVEHLFLGTLIDNNDDMRAKGRGTNPPRHVGESHPHAKLTGAQVAEIRARRRPRVVTRRMLADEYGVTIHTIDAIISGRNWGTARACGLR